MKTNIYLVTFDNHEYPEDRQEYNEVVDALTPEEAKQKALERFGAYDFKRMQEYPWTIQASLCYENVILSK